MLTVEVSLLTILSSGSRPSACLQVRRASCNILAITSLAASLSAGCLTASRPQIPGSRLAAGSLGQVWLTFRQVLESSEQTLIPAATRRTRKEPSQQLCMQLAGCLSPSESLRHLEGSCRRLRSNDSWS